MSSSSEAEVLFHTHGAARIITLNRPKALNALNLTMVRKIYPAMKVLLVSTSHIITRFRNGKRTLLLA